MQERMAVNNQGLIWLTQINTEAYLPPFFVVKTIGEIHGEESIFSIKPFCSNESSYAETTCRTEDGSRRSFCRTGVASGLTVGL